MKGGWKGTFCFQVMNVGSPKEPTFRLFFFLLYAIVYNVCLLWFGVQILPGGPKRAKSGLQPGEEPRQ